MAETEANKGPLTVTIGWYPSLLSSGRKPTVEPTKSGFVTSYQPFADQIEHAAKGLENFFSIKKKRPYVGMILGPPGSGKSYLAQKLAEKVGATAVEINLSQFQEPRELLRALRDRLNVNRKPKVVLLDEFDVTAGQSSAVRYLIAPLWDKKIEVDFSISEFDETAFILAGSYLSDLHTFEHLSQAFEEINLPLLLGDLGAYYDEEVAIEFSTDLLNGRSHIESNDSASVAARLAHLTNLEKLPDLLSRVNGFKIELLNLSDPLSVSPWAPFKLCFCQRNTPTDLLSHDETLRIQKLNDPGKYRITFNHPKTGKILLFARPLECYKHSLLAERFLRVCDQVEMQMKTRRGKDWDSATLEVPLVHFLTVVPLRYGMRSLELLADTIGWDEQKWSACEFDQNKLDDIKGHILWDIDEMSIRRVWAESINSSSEAEWPEQTRTIKLENPEKKKS